MTDQTDVHADARDSIVEAAAHLLRERGIHAVTTRGVAAAAGVQAPTIYRLFGDKDGLLDAVAEQVMATFVAAKTVAADDAPDTDPLDDLRDGWRMHTRFGLANPDLFRLLHARANDQRSPATEAGHEVLRAHVRRLASAGRLRVGEERATEMIQAAGTGTILTILSQPADQRDPDLADAMLDAVLHAIVTDAPAVAEPGTTPITAAFATVVPQLTTLTTAERELMSEWLSRVVADLGTGGLPKDSGH